MTNREIDVAVMAFSVGSLASLWLGYKLRQRVERWQAGRAKRHQKRVRDVEWKASSSTPFQKYKQDVRDTLAKPPQVVPLKIIPLAPKRRVHYVDVARQVSPTIQKMVDPGGVISDALRDADYSTIPSPAETARMEREDALVALTGAGYKRAAAAAALDACTLAERASGLEHWVAAALRRAVASKP